MANIKGRQNYGRVAMAVNMAVAVIVGYVKLRRWNTYVLSLYGMIDNILHV